jgi:outer membrane receptor protein involved in Fe transport
MKHLVVLILALLSLFSFAQNGKVRGIVIDESTNETLVGVAVIVSGTTSGTSTDLDGAFSLDLEPGTYTLQISYISFQTITMEGVVVKPGEVANFPDIRLKGADFELQEVVVKAEIVKTSELSLMSMKRQSSIMLDGISSSKMQLTGDATAVDAVKRVTGVSIEGGKYVYVRGLGDRYSKTTLNGLDLPGLDPDRNTLQMDIFPSNLIDNMMVSKNFSAELPADFTGGMLNVETKGFPEDKTTNFSISGGYNPSMHFNGDYITYNGGKLDFLGFDDGTRALPDKAGNKVIPNPVSGASATEISDFVKSFDPNLGVIQKNSLADFSASLTLGNQIDLKKKDDEEDGKKLGYIVSLSYKNETNFFDDVTYGEYQKWLDPDKYDLRYATIQKGKIGENNVLMGALVGIALKGKLNKFRFVAMHLQNGESKVGLFDIINDGAAVGQSGYHAISHNLEYGQRSLSNVLFHGEHVLEKSNIDIEWKLSPTYSTSSDPDIRRTAFTLETTDTTFMAGAGGNPSRIWRSLNELNVTAKIDAVKKYEFLGEKARFKMGLIHVFKYRNYEILKFDMQFTGAQNWTSYDPNDVLDADNIYPNRPNGVYYQSGNNYPNPNEYQSSVNNSGFYASNEILLFDGFKTIIGLRVENFVLRHTGRDQTYASGDEINGKNLKNEVVLSSLDLFPSVNLIYQLTDAQNLRASYSRTIARPSFKEVSYAQIIDPITNRIFNGSLFVYSDWDGKLTETRIDNIDLRWEYFGDKGQLVSLSGFYKKFDRPIELVRIPEQQTSTEYQPRNVGDGTLYGLEFEFRKNFGFISPFMSYFNIGGNLTLAKSIIAMTDAEFRSRKTYQKTGETIEDTRAMAGQSPYVVNASLTYENPELGVETGFFYNVKGPTLYVVGLGIYPDVYVEPFHSLNFGFNKKIGKSQKASINMKVSNILGSKIESVYKSYNAENQIYSSINPGMSFGLGFSMRL